MRDLGKMEARKRRDRETASDSVGRLSDFFSIRFRGKRDVTADCIGRAIEYHRGNYSDRNVSGKKKFIFCNFG